MNSAYKKECLIALVAFALMTLMTHIFPMYFLFPGLTESTIFGFPTHYFLTIVIGWLVLIPVYWIYINVSEKVDAEISDSGAPQSSAGTGSPSTQSSGGAE